MIQKFLGVKPGFPYQTNPKFIYKSFVLLGWGVLLLPLPSLLSYTSPTAEVWQRYSAGYAGLLLVYFGLFCLWPLLLGLPDRYINRFSQFIEELVDQPQVYIRFVVSIICLNLLILMVIPRWAWGQNRQLQVEIFLVGVWVSLMPTLWVWSLKGWPKRFISVFELYGWLTQNIFLWLRPLLAAGIVLLSAELALQGVPQYGFIIPALLVAAGLGWIAYYRRHWIILALIPGSLIIPIEVNAGSEYSRPHTAVLLLLLLLGLWVLDMVVQRQIKLPRSWTLLPLLIFTIVVLFSFSMGQLSWYPIEHASFNAQIGGTIIFILSFAAFLMVACYVREMRWLEWMTWSFIALGAVYCIAFLLPKYGQQLMPLQEAGLSWRDYIGRFQRGSDGSLFWLWLTALSFSQAAFNRRLHLGWRLALGFVTLLVVYIGLFPKREWVSGYGPSLIAIGVILWLGAPRLGLLATFAGMAGLAVKLQKLLSEVLFIGDNSYSLATRHEAWIIVLQLAQVNPWFGLGPANYYYYTPLNPIRGYFVRFNSHSQYVDLVAQTGLLGFACFFWLLGTVAWLGWRLRNQVPDGFARAYVYGALGGLVGMVVSAGLGDWVLPFTYNVGLTGFRASMFGWIFLGGLVALEQIFRHTDDNSGPAKEV